MFVNPYLYFALLFPPETPAEEGAPAADAVDVPDDITPEAPSCA